jgi:MFS family permease
VDPDRRLGGDLHPPARHHGRQRGAAVIREDLDASFTDLQWVVDAYALTLAALVLTAGSLADRLGRRRLFAGGLAVFSAASLLSGAGALLVALKPLETGVRSIP